MIMSCVRALVAAGVWLALCGFVNPSLTGTVQAGRSPITGATVTVFASAKKGVQNLGSAQTDAQGNFQLSYAKPSGAPALYAIASGGSVGRTRPNAASVLMAVIGPPRNALTSIVINELTTVASVFPLAQFFHRVFKVQRPNAERRAYRDFQQVAARHHGQGFSVG